MDLQIQLQLLRIQQQFAYGGGGNYANAIYAISSYAKFEIQLVSRRIQLQYAATNSNKSRLCNQQYSSKYSYSKYAQITAHNTAAYLQNGGAASSKFKYKYGSYSYKYGSISIQQLLSNPPRSRL